MKIIGLDLSLVSTGIVVIDDRGNIVYGETAGGKLKQSARVKRKIERQLYIAKHVVGIIKKFLEEDVEIVIEGYSFGARGRQNDLAELAGVVKAQIWLEFGLEPVIMPVTRARKIVLGKGNVKKKTVVPRLQSMGVQVDQPDIADAYIVAEAFRKSNGQLNLKEV